MPTVAPPARARSRRWGGAKSLKIDVVDNQIESALKALKKQMVKEGLFKDMKRREYYEKPSVKRKRKQAAARKKRLKALKRSQGDSD
jgi:small subunit ribosomal protein S21